MILKTSESTESITWLRKRGVGVGDNGNDDSDSDGGDDGDHGDEHSPQGSGQAHLQTHQLIQPGLWSSIMRLIE